MSNFIEKIRTLSCKLLKIGPRLDVIRTRIVNLMTLKLKLIQGVEK